MIGFSYPRHAWLQIECSDHNMALARASHFHPAPPPPFFRRLCHSDRMSMRVSGEGVGRESFWEGGLSRWGAGDWGLTSRPHSWSKCFLWAHGWDLVRLDLWHCEKFDVRVSIFLLIQKAKFSVFFRTWSSDVKTLLRVWWCLRHYVKLTSKKAWKTWRRTLVWNLLACSMRGVSRSQSQRTADATMCPSAFTCNTPRTLLPGENLTPLIISFWFVSNLHISEPSPPPSAFIATCLNPS